MRPITLFLLSALVILEAACGGAPVPPSPSPSPRPTQEPPTATTKSPATVKPSPSPKSATETPAPQPILLRRPCGRDYLVRANHALQIFYGGWGVQGESLAGQWATSLVIDLTIDGQPVPGGIQPPTQDLPYNCRPSGEETYWVYYMTVIPGLPPGDHDVSVTFSSLRPLPDGSGPTWGPGELFENTFRITAQ
jgi:hypothetical protein